MASLFSTAGLASTIVRHPWRTIVLWMAFIVAAAVPLLLGIITIIVATGMTALAANLISVNEVVSIMIIMIGLAVGIDYALFVVERYREERRRGLAKQEAFTVAGGTAGKAVFFIRRHGDPGPDGHVHHPDEHLPQLGRRGDPGRTCSAAGRILGSATESDA